MQWLASICVRRPVFATVLILFIVVVGIIGYKSLNVDRFPNVDLPMVQVITTLPGAAPEEVETELSDKIEEAINTINGIDELRSVSTEGVSQVVVSFQLDKDINVAAQEVREHVSTMLPDLPEGTKSPIINKLDPDAAPVLFLALQSERPHQGGDRVRRPRGPRGAGERARRRAGHHHRRPQAADPGGARPGAAARRRADRGRRAAGHRRPERHHAGRHRRHRPVAAHLPGQRPRAERRGLGEIVVRNVDNHPITINDVGRVIDGEEEAATAASIAGKPAVVLSIRKQSGENSVAVVDALHERMKELAPTMPAGYKLERHPRQHGDRPAPASTPSRST